MLLEWIKNGIDVSEERIDYTEQSQTVILYIENGKNYMEVEVTAYGIMDWEIGGSYNPNDFEVLYHWKEKVVQVQGINLYIDGVSCEISDELLFEVQEHINEQLNK